ncbi:SA1362 family protein [Bacillus sp. KICET-3]|uniref:SA1362 family protein n=1 Tax=Bacillus sp. KICET-3 TaxID=3083256 RepID=UPI00295E6F97|nr:SA1362 family protein [Bacillus sp. KICET-3]WOV59300.1 SA1362 family protein [Bacillus sp. KICET-3]
MKQRVHPVSALVIALGILGFVYFAVTSPGQIVFAAVGAIIYFVVRYISNRDMGGEGAAFKKAAKQSHKRFQDHKKRSARGRVNHLRSVPSINKTKPVLVKKKSQTQLTVIEGKKSKKKNRAFF